MFDLIEYLIKQGIPHTVSDDGRITVGGGLDLCYTTVTELPGSLNVGGYLLMGGTGITTLPDGLTMGDSLDLNGTSITALPEKFTCQSLYLDPERISNVAYRKGCGLSDRTIFAAWTGKEIRIAARCFFDTLAAFERAVDGKYTGKAADAYKQAARECVDELSEKLGK